jgi:hypothetical protein
LFGSVVAGQLSFTATFACSQIDFQWLVYISLRTSTTAFQQKSEVRNIIFISASLKYLIELRVAPSGVAWKGVSSEEVTYVQAADLKWAQWLRVARGFQLRLGLRDHKKHKFDGFVREVSPHPSLSRMLTGISGSRQAIQGSERTFRYYTRNA